MELEKEKRSALHSAMHQSLGADRAGTLSAQTNITQNEATSEEIRLAVVQNIGAEDKTVEVLATRYIVTVSRVNSTMNNTTHQGFNDEASAIASVVSRAIANKSQYEKVHTIRVQYLSRSERRSKNVIIDSVEFRKNQKGVFELHTT